MVAMTGLSPIADNLSPSDHRSDSEKPKNFSTNHTSNSQLLSVYVANVVDNLLWGVGTGCTVGLSTGFGKKSLWGLQRVEKWLIIRLQGGEVSMKVSKLAEVPIEPISVSRP